MCLRIQADCKVVEEALSFSAHLKSGFQDKNLPHTSAVNPFFIKWSLIWLSKNLHFCIQHYLSIEAFFKKRVKSQQEDCIDYRMKRNKVIFWFQFMGWRFFKRCLIWVLFWGRVTLTLLAKLFEPFRNATIRKEKTRKERFD